MKNIDNDIFDCNLHRRLIDDLGDLPFIFKECVQLGWENYRNLVVAHPSAGQYRTRTGRNIVNDEVVLVASEVFGSYPDIVSIEEVETTTFMYQDKYRFRFKKTNTDGRTSNVSTKRARDILGQGHLWNCGIESTSSPAWITVGYVPDDVQMNPATVTLGVESFAGSEFLYPIPDEEPEGFRLRYAEIMEALDQIRKRA